MVVEAADALHLPGNHVLGGIAADGLILRAVQASDSPVGASAIAGQLGISRPTAQRYLTELHRRGVLDLELEYGSTGRPVNLYHVARR